MTQFAYPNASTSIAVTCNPDSTSALVGVGSRLLDNLCPLLDLCVHERRELLRRTAGWNWPHDRQFRPDLRQRQDGTNLVVNLPDDRGRCTRRRKQPYPTHHTETGNGISDGWKVRHKRRSFWTCNGNRSQ